MMTTNQLATAAANLARFGAANATDETLAQDADETDAAYVARLVSYGAIVAELEAVALLGDAL